MTGKTMPTAGPGPGVRGSAPTGPGPAEHQRRAEIRRARVAPSTPGLCETCQTTGWVPAWDPTVEAYALTRCPDCEDE